MSRPIVQSPGVFERDRIQKDLFSQGPAGALLSTVFVKPEDVGAYDSVASQAQMLRNDMYNTYMQPSMDQIVNKRMQHISSMLGLGEAGTKALKMANTFAPGITEMILGHHGGMAAQANVMNSANAIGAVRSGYMGGFADPQQMNRNNQLGLRIAMNAYRNNFDASGGVDINQTHGLSLVQAAAISNQTLQDNSQYESFAKKARKYDATLTDSEIKNFKDGTGATKKVTDAFNKHIKQFTSEINSFTASVTKMTGDFEESVQFLQRATGGQLFKDTESASKLRKDAVRMANNLRIIAADSGISAQELYMRSGLGGDIFEASQGRTNAVANKFANKVSGTRLGLIGAAAFAEWAKKNPNASKEQKDAMGEAVNANLADYGQGDVAKMNVVLARLVDEGQVAEEEAKRLARNGNAEQMYHFLAKKVGGTEALNDMMRDGRNLVAWRDEHASTLAELDTEGFSRGLERERLEKGGRRSMDSEMTWLVNTAGEDRREGVKKEIEKLTNSAFANEDVLKQAGMTEAQAKAFSEQARREGWDRDRILQEINENYYDVNTLKLNREAYKQMKQDAQDSSVLNDKEKEGINEGVIKSFGRDANEDDVKRARRLVKNKGIAADIRKLVTSLNKEKDATKRDEILNEIGNKFTKGAVTGENGLSYFSTPDTAQGAENVDAVLTNSIQWTEAGEKDVTAQRKLIEAGKKAYSEAISAGATEDAAWKRAQDEISQQDSDRKYFSTINVTDDTKKRGIDINMAQSAAENVMRGFFKGTGASDEQQKEFSTKVQAEVNKLMTDNPELLAEDAVKEALLNVVGDPADDKGLSYRVGGMRNYLDDHGDEVNKNIRQAYIDNLSSIGVRAGSAIELTTEQEEEAKGLAQEYAMGEDKKRADTFSSGSLSEDAANMSKGMGMMSNAIRDATEALKNLASATQVLAADQRDAANQNKGFYDRLKVNKERRGAMLDRYGLGEKGQTVGIIRSNFENILKPTDSKGVQTSFDKYFNNHNIKGPGDRREFLRYGFKKILSTEGLDLSNDEAVKKAIKEQFGQGFDVGHLDKLKDYINKQNNATPKDNHYINMAQLIAGFTAGVGNKEASATEIADQLLARKLHVDGIDSNITDALQQILTAIQNLKK